MKKTRKIKGIILKSFIVIAVVIMLISVMPGEDAEMNVHVSNWDGKNRIEKIYKVTKITLSCNICKLVLI